MTEQIEQQGGDTHLSTDGTGGGGKTLKELILDKMQEQAEKQFQLEMKLAAYESRKKAFAAANRQQGSKYIKLSFSLLGGSYN